MAVEEDASVDISYSVDQTGDGDSDSDYGVESMSNEKPVPKKTVVAAAIPPKSRANNNNIIPTSVAK